MNSFSGRIILTVLFILNIGLTKVTAQKIKIYSIEKGIWKGGIQINDNRVFNIAIEKVDNDGDYKYFFHSIDQMSYNFPIRKVTATDDSLFLFISSLNAFIVLKVTDNTANGYFTQRDIRFPVKLEKTKHTLQKPARPQEPIYPLPYKEEEVIIKNEAANVSLAGTMTLPKDNKKHPAILLIPGSGPSDRDQSIFGHKNFLVLADILTRKGFIILRMDDRGTGESSGDFENCSIKDFAGDAAACIKYLKGRKEVGQERVGVIGHSLGADIAAYLAAHTNDPDFLVLMAASAEPLNKTIIRQTEKIYEDNGASLTAIALNTDILKTVFDVVEHTANDSLAIEKLNTLLPPLNERLAAIDIKQQELIESVYPLSANKFGNMLSGAMRFDLFYDPSPTYLKIKKPVLLLHGLNDVQVLSDNANSIMKLLNEHKHPLTKMKIFSSTNHLLQQCKTCKIDEYQQIENTFSPEVLFEMINWLKEVSGR